MAGKAADTNNSIGLYKYIWILRINTRMCFGYLKLKLAR